MCVCVCVCDTCLPNLCLVEQLGRWLHSQQAYLYIHLCESEMLK